MFWTGDKEQLSWNEYYKLKFYHIYIYKKGKFNQLIQFLFKTVNLPQHSNQFSLRYHVGWYKRK